MHGSRIRLGAVALRSGMGLLALVVCAAAPLATTLGCAMDGDLVRILTLPEGAAAADEHAYQLGYRHGQRDDARELRSDPTRHRDAYDWETKSAFVAGYRDGYSGRRSRYGRSDGGWPRDHDDDEVGMVSAVPSWLVGGFRGFSERDGSGLALTVHRDASVVLVTDGRKRQGVYRRGQVHLRNGAYAVMRAREGIRFTSLGDTSNTAYLRRIE